MANTIVISTVVLCMVTFYLSMVAGFPDGPPSTEEVCKHMRPQHDANKTKEPPYYDPRHGAPPYTIKVNTTDIEPGDSVEVHIVAENGTYFEGFMIQARNAESITDEDVEAKMYGTFQAVNGSEAKSLCSNTALSHAVHKHFHNVSMTWTSPMDEDEDLKNIEFVATVVKEYDTFYMFVRSDPLNSGAQLIPSMAALVLAALVPVWSRL